MGTIIKRNGIDYLNLVKRGERTIDSASLGQGMLTDDSVKYSVRSNSKLDVKINDTIEVFGNTYRINTLPTFKKTSNTEYSYEIEAQGLMYDLLRCKFFNADGEGFKTTTDFPLIGNLEVFLVAIRNNMHRFSTNWEIGNFASTETKMITFGDDTCLSALQKICQEFKTDFWVKTEGGKFKIHTGAFGSTLPIDFEYGKGKGLYNLSRKNVDSNGIVNRLYVNGGTDNIPAGYRAFSDALKFSDAGYIEDTNLIAEMGLIEGSIDFPDIYPKRTGVVSAVGSSKFKFHDSSMDFDLNEKEADGATKYLIAGTSAKVHFNTGNLAGYEFEIKKGGYNHTTKEFEIIPFTNQTGQKFPDEVAEAFQIGVGDEYVLLDIVMPETYITNAEAELLTKANEQFALLKTVKVSYDLEVDPDYIKNLSTPISIGDYVRVKDTNLGIDKVIRVQAITRNFITSNTPTPYNYKITLADSYEISFASQMVLDITEVKNVISVTNLGDINLSKLGYKTTEELRNLVFDTDGYFDAENIKPFSIQTNMLTVGAQSQQLSCSVVFLVNNAGNPNQVETKAGALFSQTFDKTWTIAGSVQTIPDNNSRYVYAKCSKNGTSGTIYFTQAQIKFDEDVNDYYFLLGILHTVTEGVRVLSITIGTTTINGGLVRTGTISSLDGQTYFNLNTGEIKGKITFTNDSPAFQQMNDAIIIGGRNLALNSKGFIDSNSDWVRNFNLSEKLFTGQQCTVRVKFRAIGSPNDYFHINDVNGNNSFDLVKINPLEFGLTFTANADFTELVLSRLPLGSGAWYQFESFKIETGNKATDWTPAPEDIEGDIAVANQASANALAQAQNAINTANAAASVTSFMQTTVDGNVVSTGTLQVGDVNGANAGITGVSDRGTNSVRFYAGSAYAGKNTANWLMKDNGMEEQWLNGVMIRRRGVMNSNYYDEYYNLNGELAKRTAIINGKITEEWYNNGILVYQVGQNGIYFVADIAESYTLNRLLNLNSNLSTSDVSVFHSIIRSNMYQKSTNQSQFELRGNKDAYLYNAGQNIYSQGNKQYEGYKNSQSHTDNIPDGWYAFEQLGWMREDGVNPYLREVDVMRVSGGKVTQFVTTQVNTEGYYFNQF